MIKAQWFVNCNDMARRSVEAVKSGELKLVPDIHNKTWFVNMIYFMFCLLESKWIS